MLGDPVETRPTPDIIVSNMIAAEQYMLNRMTGTGKAWSHNIISILGILNQGAYSLAPTNGNPTFGKALFAYRELGNNVILPIPFTEFTGELTDQRYQFWVADASGIPYTVSGEKLAFYREGNTVKMRIYPIPSEAHLYNIVFASGALDWDAFQWADNPIMPEFSRLRQIYAALATLAKCEWQGKSAQEAAAFRQELRADLTAEYQQQEVEFRAYIRNPQHESNIGEVGYWWE